MSASEAKLNEGEAEGHICKATLDVHPHPAGNARQFTNDAKGIRALMAWLGGHSIARPIARIVFEPTGPYHHGFERRLGEAGLVVPALQRTWACALACHRRLVSASFSGCFYRRGIDQTAA